LDDAAEEAPAKCAGPDRDDLPGRVIIPGAALSVQSMPPTTVAKRNGMATGR
jgi:hypothetical protein